MEKEDYMAAALADTVLAYYDFLEKYPEGAKLKEALFKLADVIDQSPDRDTRDTMFRELITRYPSALHAIPHEDRLLYIGPPELPVYAILELIKSGEPERRLAKTIGSQVGRYKEFTVEEANRLQNMGLSDTIIDAMLEATFKAQQRETKALREQQMDELLEQTDRVQASIYDMEASFESRASLDPDMPLEAITDETGTPLKDKINRCTEMLVQLDHCKLSPNIAACLETARNDYLCE